MKTRPKILIVDDKPENLVALRTVLRDLDVQLVEAASGNDALKKTLRHDFALALLDIQMPGMDG
jgi:two-component system, sensor histidine kinase and response regulator